MAELNIYHLFATTLILICSQRRKKRRRYWIRPSFGDRTTSGEYQSLVLKMKEIDKKFLGVFACHRINLTIYWNLQSL